MHNSEHILVVDDDTEIRTLLRDYLERNGLRATAVADGRAMRAALERGRFDLVILDLMLPGEDGLSLCRDLRARSNLPVIMLTARGEETDRIVGLEMGADDYLAKPFNPRELLARIKAVLRRTRTLPATDSSDIRRFRFAGWTLELARRQLLSPDGVVVALSGGEYRLLEVLLQRPNQVLSRDQLLDLTRGREALPFDRSIDVQIGRLRRRLRDESAVLIQTVRGEGYVLAAEVETEK
jgi:two-component system OmpR family response regulator